MMSFPSIALANQQLRNPIMSQFFFFSVWKTQGVDNSQIISFLEKVFVPAVVRF